MEFGECQCFFRHHQKRPNLAHIASSAACSSSISEVPVSGCPRHLRSCQRWYLVTLRWKAQLVQFRGALWISRQRHLPWRAICWKYSYLWPSIKQKETGCSLSTRSHRYDPCHFDLNYLAAHRNSWAACSSWSPGLQPISPSSDPPRLSPPSIACHSCFIRSTVPHQKWLYFELPWAWHSFRFACAESISRKRLTVHRVIWRRPLAYRSRNPPTW